MDNAEEESCEWQIGDVRLLVPRHWLELDRHDEVGLVMLGPPRGEPQVWVRTARWRGDPTTTQGAVLNELARVHKQALADGLGFQLAEVGTKPLEFPAKRVQGLTQTGHGWPCVDDLSNEAHTRFVAIHMMYPGLELLTLHVQSRGGRLSPEEIARMATSWLFERVVGFVQE